MNKFTLATLLSMSMTTLLLSPIAMATTPPVKHIELNKKIVLDVMSVELRAKLNKFQQFAANFNQRVIDNKGREIQQATGSMKMAQPNKFRWVTNEPDESLVVSDGASVWIYNPFVEQVTAMDLNNTMTQSPLWLIANQSDDAWSNFTVEKLADTNGYAVTPKGNDNLTRKITMSFKNDAINKLVIEDAQGQTSHFTFEQFDYQTTIDQTAFNFVMPSEVDFDDQREAN